jgi:hypothetical protein
MTSDVAQLSEEAGTSICPGCALDMPRRAGALNTSYFHASPECWTVFGEVLAAEYSNAVLFGQVHQITVDAYAAQHAGGQHPDKSVGIHLSGLYLVLVRDVRPMAVAPLLHEIANSIDAWPEFPPPATTTSRTILDVALCAGDWETHVRTVREWALEVWRSWQPQHRVVHEIVQRIID